MFKRLSIMLIDNDQQYASAITSALESASIHCDLEYTEDKEGFDESINNKHFDCFIYNKAIDFDYTYVLNQLRAHQINASMVLLIQDEKEFAVVNNTGFLNQALKAGVAHAVFYKNYVHLASVISCIYKAKLLEQSISSLRQNMSEAAKREEDLLEKSISAVCFIQDGVHIYANTHYASLFGFKSSEDLIGLPFIDLVEVEHAKAIKQLLKAFAKNDYTHNSIDCKNVNITGASFASSMSFTPANFEGERCTQVVITPTAAHTPVAKQTAVAQPKAPVHSGEYEALNDLHVEISNRLALKERLNTLFLSPDRANSALMVMSIDNIEQINDLKLSGRTEFMNEYAKIITEFFFNESVFKLGDALFAVLSVQKDDNILKKAQAFKALIFGHEFIVQRSMIKTTVSIGICHDYPEMSSAEDLLENAFECSQKVKQKQGNDILTYVAITANQTESKPSDRVLEAIQNNQFVLKFQHIYNTLNETEQFFEVFLRLKLDDDTLLKPENFMATAKACGLNDSLDKWVMMNACKQLKIYHAAYPNTKILINLTEFVLQEANNVQLIQKLLSALGSQFAGSVVFQFTEQSIMLYLKTAIKTLSVIKAMGSHISISGFGASINSFSIFEHVTCDMVKLDKTLTQDWSSEGAVERLKETVAEISELGKQTIIPFIDNPTSMAKAWSIGAAFLQGYFLHSPSNTMQPDTEQ